MKFACDLAATGAGTVSCLLTFTSLTAIGLEVLALSTVIWEQMSFAPVVVYPYSLQKQELLQPIVSLFAQKVHQAIIAHSCFSEYLYFLPGLRKQKQYDSSNHSYCITEIYTIDPYLISFLLSSQIGWYQDLLFLLQSSKFVYLKRIQTI